MSDRGKLSSTLDGVYWSSNGHRNERQQSYQNNNRSRSHLYENGDSTETNHHLFRSLTHTAPRPQQNVPNQSQRTNDLLENLYHTQAEILQQLRCQNENYFQLVQQQQNFVTQDAFTRYLQHFEQSVAELRALVMNKIYEDETNMNFEPSNNLMSVAVPTAFVKQENETAEHIQGDEELANTLLTLGKKDVCQTLHAFQSQGQMYYWSALVNKGRDCLPISEKVSQTIEEAYQRLLQSNGQDPRIPRSLRVDDVTIYFDSREGTVDGQWVRFERLKK